ncbi:Inositolphosphorylceramide synthase subunit Kei1-domain-containing protein [Glomus cerebriforme]|uniref:Inositolphosphorylceramide synthase subunit Kei1-domain-containing protein n=1 Tax=Glomus cerebriforme TaxID=658196 RepID=A0A397SNC7_9GLOM|nr:Inositolphosphorylceramide synthase subunit Kei1-domain-containing protein [Glomus cerebriforme]
MVVSTKLQFKNFCGIVDIQRGVILITVFALLNKVSGFFGIPTLFYGGGIISIISYIYSIIASIAIVYFLLYGVFPENPTILKYYSIFYWIDLAVNGLFTIIFGIWWYLVVDHLPLAEIENQNSNNNETATILGTTPTLPAWKTESAIAIISLIAVTLVHIYFAFVINSYAMLVQKKQTYFLASGTTAAARLSTSGMALLDNPQTRHVNIDDDDDDVELGYH